MTSMSATFFYSILALSVLVGAAGALQVRRSRTKTARLRHAKVAVGGFGSLMIILCVNMIESMLSLLVIGAAVYWLTRHLRTRNSPLVRFIDKQIAKTS